MKKEILNPEAGEWARHETAFSAGVSCDFGDYRRVFISGTTSDADGLEQQTREILEEIQSRLENAGGSMDDVVRVRVYVKDSEMSEEDLETIHGVRLEFFDSDRYPASTLIGVSEFVQPEYLIEIDAEAVIPA